MGIRSVWSCPYPSRNPHSKSDDVVGESEPMRRLLRENIPEPGVPESFKVLIKELQSLALDVKVLTEKDEEVEIKESIDDESIGELDAILDGEDYLPKAKDVSEDDEETDKETDEETDDETVELDENYEEEEYIHIDEDLEQEIENFEDIDEYEEDF